jgi:hypothetical protein
LPGSRLSPGEHPFQIDRHALLVAPKNELGRDVRDFTLAALSDEKAVFRYDMHTLPAEIGDRIGTSTLDATQAVLYSGLWFNDETFVVTRRKP